MENAMYPISIDDLMHTKPASTQRVNEVCYLFQLKNIGQPDYAVLESEFGPAVGE
jgi:hypothetical protein